MYSILAISTIWSLPPSGRAVALLHTACCALHNPPDGGTTVQPLHCLYNALKSVVRLFAGHIIGKYVARNRALPKPPSIPGDRLLRRLQYGCCLKSLCCIKHCHFSLTHSFFFTVIIDFIFNTPFEIFKIERKKTEYAKRNSVIFIYGGLLTPTCVLNFNEIR